MFTIFMCLVLVSWLVVVAPATRDFGKLLGKPPGASLLAWFVAGLFGHDDQAEDICPRATWLAEVGTARANTGWHAALTWAAAHPGPVLAGAAGVVAAFWLPEYASLGAIVLVRGLPGSGKSTWAAARAGDVRLSGGQARVVSADEYFMRGDKYCFDPALLPQAHADCLARAKAGHELGEEVYVANTFTQAWEMAPYLALDPEAAVFVCPPVPGRLGVHGVPQAAWDRMAARWEAHPGEFLLCPQGVPCLCEYCGFLKNPERMGDCQACGYCTGKVFPWVGPGNYWRSNSQASVALGPCDTPEELHAQLRESQGTGDWRGWHITQAPYEGAAGS